MILRSVVLLLGVGALHQPVFAQFTGPIGTPGSNNCSSCGNPFSVTIPSTTAGDQLFVLATGSNPSNSVTAVSGCGGTWSQVGLEQGNQFAAIWENPNISGGCTSVSVSVSDNNFEYIIVPEFRGGSTSGALDGAVVNTNSGTASVSIATTNAKDLVLSTCTNWYYGGTVTGPTGGFTSVLTANSDQMSGYLITTTTGTKTITWTLSGSVSVDCMTAAFKASVASATGGFISLIGVGK